MSSATGMAIATGIHVYRLSVQQFLKIFSASTQLVFLLSMSSCLSVDGFCSSFLLASLSSHTNLSSCVVWLLSLLPLLDR